MVNFTKKATEKKLGKALGKIHLDIKELKALLPDSADVLVEDIDTRDAVAAQVAGIGKQLKKISGKYGLLEAYPDIDWEAIDHKRFVVGEDYLHLDMTKLWEVATLEMPKLEKMIADINEENDDVKKAMKKKEKKIRKTREKSTQKIIEEIEKED